MLGFLGNLGLGSKIALGMGVALLVVIGLSGWYFKSSQNTIATLNQTIAAEKARAASAEANLKVMREDVNEQSRQLARLANEIAENRKASQNLEDTFAEHDLNALVNAKPNLVERRVNDGTRRTLERLENITDPRSYNVDPEEFVIPETEKEQE